jgi:hypothetical protein
MMSFRMALSPAPLEFRAAFARRFSRSPESFEREVFVRCVPPWYRPVAWAIIRWVPAWFSQDWQVLQDVARATSLEEVRVLSGDFRGGIRHRRSLIRDRIGFRVSGRRLLALARHVLAASSA